MKKFILFLSCFLIFMSCKKNRDASLVFWYPESIADKLRDNDVQILNYYINGKLIWTADANDYWSGSGYPDCNSGVVYNVVLNRGKNRAVNYAVIDENDQNWWSGSIELKPGCLALELD